MSYREYFKVGDGLWDDNGKETCSVESVNYSTGLITVRYSQDHAMTTSISLILMFYKKLPDPNDLLKEIL